ncbi:hypothetical protein L6452_30965 [Arctium lappa]|uniref:Uncharacterized protein n=1 Tax=Arctium lappa TaxID=4217 RepID=A0ACB8ZJG8_ARCLA|nr:hypothetical protein L6452_30965 [Arctium lappa]
MSFTIAAPKVRAGSIERQVGSANVGPRCWDENDLGNMSGSLLKRQDLCRQGRTAGNLGKGDGNRWFILGIAGIGIVSWTSEPSK